MFELPQATDDTSSSVEGSNLENPIHLPGASVDHFRFFLRILYPFINQTPVVEFDEWIGVLNLATMWFFKEILERAITELSQLIKEKSVMERIALAREYRVAKWLRDAYFELTQKRLLDFEELGPAEPYYYSSSSSSSHHDDSRDWEADSKKWQAISRDWETLARISQLQKKVVTASSTSTVYSYHCQQCGTTEYTIGRPCKCRILTMVDEAFRVELESLKEDIDLGHVEPPLPSKDAASKKRKRKKRS